MQIRKLTLRNFRNFKNAVIEFSCSKDKNFTIILGQNTYGKTTLVKSFIWCLYRINLFDDKILLNDDIADNLGINKNEDAKVELELEHKGYTYKITTKETYFKNYNGNISVNIKARSTVVKVDGENAIPIPSTKVNEEIDSILRPELKEYFFFDGETNTIESVSSKKSLTSAVTNILGLNKVELIKEYYDPSKNESVTSYLRKELVSNDDNILDNLNEELSDLQSKKDSINSEIVSTENQIDGLKEQLETENNRLDANKDIEEDQKEKKRLDREINELKCKKETQFSRLIQSFNSSNAFLKVLFAASFKKYNIKNIMESSNFSSSSSSYKGINEEAVDELIRQGTCICGTKIINGNDAYQHLISAKQHMEPHDFGKYISDFVSAEEFNIANAQTTLENLLDSAGDINDLIEQVDNDEDRLKTIRNRIAGRDDVGEIQRTINNINFQLGQQTSILKRLKENDLPEMDEKIHKLNEKISNVSIKNEANAFIQTCIDYATNIFRLASKKIDSSKIMIREKLQEEVGKIFKSMYHGNREIKIDENFKASAVISVHGQDKQLDKSTGLGTVVNYSFVAGLMNLAKQHIVNDDDITDNDSTTEVYPLVMDAPFSNTDDEHIKNICNALPNFCDQVIMFVMQKDFGYAQKSIVGKIGKMYNLNKLSETEAEVEEVII